MKSESKSNTALFSCLFPTIVAEQIRVGVVDFVAFETTDATSSKTCKQGFFGVHEGQSGTAQVRNTVDFGYRPRVHAAMMHTRCPKRYVFVCALKVWGKRQTPILDGSSEVTHSHAVA
eukprot:TRINITY_DN21598_c0_g1_i1.p2 TRINITY_DN21598_c0_g1~~TRINITY_DN21598_c0_g1_i1.p2  ORF type:complete len:118 (-),score=1.06 TRINITY_DN21598_c0_g1_i1:66-419(-)